MPNGTLCGKAVVDMVLGEVSGTTISELQEHMVEKGDIPANYLITEERISKARLWPTVEAQDSEGVQMNGLV